MINYIIGAIILLIIGCAVWYVVKAKKDGRKCIGCSANGSCGKCVCACSKEKDNRK